MKIVHCRLFFKKEPTLIKEEAELLPANEIRNQELQTTASWSSNPYIIAATSNNTRKAYRSDILHFEQWGGRLPASPEILVGYLQAFAENLNPRTLSRRLTALKHWHTYQGFPDPTQHPAIGKTLAGITRIHGSPKEKAWPLSPEDLLCIVTYLSDENTFASWRDIALLQIGFFGAFRRSELVAIQYEHITWQKSGIEIMIPHSKTDQNHEGQHCAIPYGRGKLCPIQALETWLKLSAIKAGPIFRRIFANGKLDENALTPLSVNHILRRRAKESGLTCADKLSSHSLRRGLATSASRMGAGLPAIMRQGRWKQVNTVMEYIEASERFAENAASSVLNKMDSDTE